MSFRVVCISRSIGAGGEAIGQEVARRLGYRYVDEQIITWAARQAQVDPAIVAAAERRQPLLARVLAKLPAARDLATTLSLIAVGVIETPVLGGQRSSPDDLRILIRAAIHEVAQAGDAVILAHAASMALAGVDGILRVLVTASPAARAERLAAEQKSSLRDAEKAVAESDRERREYFRVFYEIEEELPTHYDLTITTDTLSLERAADVIVAVLG